MHLPGFAFKLFPARRPITKFEKKSSRLALALDTRRLPEVNILGIRLVDTVQRALVDLCRLQVSLRGCSKRRDL